jgi:hypothetical protein
MWIVAVAWIYVVGLMAVTEPTVVAGIMTFFGYCVLPLSILFYLTGGRARRERRARRDAQGNPGSNSSDTSTLYVGDSGSTILYSSGDTSGSNDCNSADSGSTDSGSCSDSGSSSD